MFPFLNQCVKYTYVKIIQLTRLSVVSDLVLCIVPKCVQYNIHNGVSSIVHSLGQCARNAEENEYNGKAGKEV